MKKKASERGWLRPLNSVGPMTAYHWIVEGYSSHINAEFLLRDCSNEIRLDCFCIKPKHIKRHRKMIRKLVDALLVFDETLAAMADEVIDDE